LTTLQTQYEREIKALLHIPETVETAGADSGRGPR